MSDKIHPNKPSLTPEDHARLIGLLETHLEKLKCRASHPSNYPKKKLEILLTNSLICIMDPMV